MSILTGRWSKPLALIVHASLRATYYSAAGRAYDNNAIVIGGGNLGKLTALFLASGGTRGDPCLGCVQSTHLAD